MHTDQKLFVGKTQPSDHRGLVREFAPTAAVVVQRWPQNWN